MRSPSLTSTMIPTFLAVLALLFVSAISSDAFYLPGIAPNDYKQGDKVNVYVNSLQSQMKSMLPFDHYHPRLHQCQPSVVEDQGESLGSVLTGDRLKTSPIVLKMMQPADCLRTCTVDIPAQDTPFLVDRLREDYKYRWEVDGLPAGEEYIDTQTNERFYKLGFPMGQCVNHVCHLNNHFRITVQYHQEQQGDTYRVVGVLVQPESRLYTDKENPCGVGSGTWPKVVVDPGKALQVTYTYDVAFEQSQVPWRTRWDMYLHVFDPKIHWFNLINSIVIALFLTGMVGMILLRALHKDILRYNQVEAQEDAQEEFGWKLVHGDVFRPPLRFQYLCVLLGSGSQLFLMACVSLVFAALGFLSPSNRGSLMTSLVVCYVLAGGLAGYISARYYKMLGGESWKRNVLLTAFLVPGTVFLMFVILNFILVGAGSSAAMPFGTIFALIVLWFFVSVPLSFVGAYVAFKKERIETPVRINSIPRQIPKPANACLRPVPSILISGVLPFGAIFIELYFILNSIWSHQVYYVFGFLFFVGLVLVLTVAEVTILMCYFQLCAEDYHWWWRSYFTAGASAVYVFVYSMTYYGQRLMVDNAASTVLYVGYSIVMSFLYFLVTAFVGFTACLYFVRKIYGSIKID